MSAQPTPLPPSPGPQPLAVTAAELAKLLQCSQRHVERLDAACKLPAPIRLGRSKRWIVSEIRAWLAAGCPERSQWEAMKGTVKR